jgi:hypothetical protein
MPDIGASVQEATRFVTSMNWSQPSWDVFIVLFFIVSALLYGFSMGRDRILTMLVSVYMSIAVVKYIPYVTAFNASVSFNDSFAIRISVFLGAFVLLFFLLSQSALLKMFGGLGEQGSWWQVGLFSLLQAGLLISVTLSFFPAASGDWISPFIRAVFVSDLAKTIWVLAPITVMIFLGRFQRDV